MKRFVTWGAGVIGVVVAIGVFVFARSQSMTSVFAESAKAAKSPAAAAAKPAAPSSAAESSGESAPAGKVAYTFPDEAAMRRFAEQSQQRQAVLLRMSVLRAYLTEEQSNLMEMDKRFAADYGLDVTKSYFLDAQRRVLLEHMPAAETPGAESAPPRESAPAKAR
jgi:hypothetical protein